MSDAACKHESCSFDRSVCACGSMHDYCDECGKVANTIGRVSGEILSADLGPQVDEAIQKILGPTPENPEEDGDGA